MPAEGVSPSAGTQGPIHPVGVDGPRRHRCARM